MDKSGPLNSTLLNVLLTSVFKDVTPEPTDYTKASSLDTLGIFNSTGNNDTTNADIRETIGKAATTISLLKPLQPALVPCADIHVSGVVDDSATTGPSAEYVASDVSALLYIVIVLGFYAFAMVVLMVAYIRRENQEAEISHYFTEYIKRDKFETARYQNLQKLESVRRTMEALYKPVVLKETGV